jgi:hypothetical protein
MMTLREPGQGSRNHPTYLEWSRYVSAFLLMGYGASKLAHLQFRLNHTLAARPVGSLTGYELTWFYYGYSRLYSVILGVVQVAGGGLLLFRKTALLGAFAMLPVIVNILLIDVLILPPDWGPTVPALIIFVSLMLILSREARNFIPLVWTAQCSEPLSSRRLHWTIRIAVLVALVAITTAGIITVRR